jgi:superfamily I DNA and/or RNA helicase
MSFAKSRKYSFHASILKFIEDKTLINVSITRAKKKLILVGNSKTLCQSKLIESVICAIGKENTIIL